MKLKPQKLTRREGELKIYKRQTARCQHQRTMTKRARVKFTHSCVILVCCCCWLLLDIFFAVAHRTSDLVGLKVESSQVNGKNEMFFN